VGWIVLSTAWALLTGCTARPLSLAVSLVVVAGTHLQVNPISLRVQFRNVRGSLKLVCAGGRSPSPILPALALPLE
jgi:hypothetical protein